jgi:hypothetical protein
VGIARGATKDLGYAGRDTLTGLGMYRHSYRDDTGAIHPADHGYGAAARLWRSYTETTATGWRTVSSRLASSTKSPLS